MDLELAKKRKFNVGILLIKVLHRLELKVAERSWNEKAFAHFPTDAFRDQLVYQQF